MSSGPAKLGEDDLTNCPVIKKQCINTHFCNTVFFFQVLSEEVLLQQVEARFNRYASTRHWA